MATKLPETVSASAALASDVFDKITKKAEAVAALTAAGSDDANRIDFKNEDFAEAVKAREAKAAERAAAVASIEAAAKNLKALGVAVPAFNLPPAAAEPEIPKPDFSAEVASVKTMYESILRNVNEASELLDAVRMDAELNIAACAAAACATAATPARACSPVVAVVVVAEPDHLHYNFKVASVKTKLTFQRNSKIGRWAVTAGKDMSVVQSGDSDVVTIKADCITTSVIVSFDAKTGYPSGATGLAVNTATGTAVGVLSDWQRVDCENNAI